MLGGLLSRSPVTPAAQVALICAGTNPAVILSTSMMLHGTPVLYCRSVITGKGMTSAQLFFGLRSATCQKGVEFFILFSVYVYQNGHSLILRGSSLEFANNDIRINLEYQIVRHTKNTTLYLCLQSNSYFESCINVYRIFFEVFYYREIYICIF